MPSCSRTGCPHSLESPHAAVSDKLGLHDEAIPPFSRSQSQRVLLCCVGLTAEGPGFQGVACAAVSLAGPTRAYELSESFRRNSVRNSPHSINQKGRRQHRSPGTLPCQPDRPDLSVLGAGQAACGLPSLQPFGWLFQHRLLQLKQASLRWAHIKLLRSRAKVTLDQAGL